MDATCWKVVGMVVAGYPVLLVAIGALWRKYQRALVDLGAEKDAKVAVLEALKSELEKRRRK